MTFRRATHVLLACPLFVMVRGNAKGVEVMNLKFLPIFLGRLPDRLTIGESGRIFNRLQTPERR